MEGLVNDFRKTCDDARTALLNSHQTLLEEANKLQIENQALRARAEKAEAELTASRENVNLLQEQKRDLQAQLTDVKEDLTSLKTEHKSTNSTLLQMINGHLLNNGQTQPRSQVEKDKPSIYTANGRPPTPARSSGPSRERGREREKQYEQEQGQGSSRRRSHSRGRPAQVRARAKQVESSPPPVGAANMITPTRRAERSPARRGQGASHGVHPNANANPNPNPNPIANSSPIHPTNQAPFPPTMPTSKPKQKQRSPRKQPETISFSPSQSQSQSQSHSQGQGQQLNQSQSLNHAQSQSLNKILNQSQSPTKNQGIPNVLPGTTKQISPSRTISFFPREPTPGIKLEDVEMGVGGDGTNAKASQSSNQQAHMPSNDHGQQAPRTPRFKPSLIPNKTVDHTHSKHFPSVARAIAHVARGRRNGSSRGREKDVDGEEGSEYQDEEEDGGSASASADGSEAEVGNEIIPDSDAFLVDDSESSFEDKVKFVQNIRKRVAKEAKEAREGGNEDEWSSEDMPDYEVDYVPPRKSRTSQRSKSQTRNHAPTQTQTATQAPGSSPARGVKRSARTDPSSSALRNQRVRR